MQLFKMVIFIDREAGEVMKENDTQLWERNYTNKTLKKDNNKTDLNARRVFKKGSLHSVVKYNTKYNYHIRRTMRINGNKFKELNLNCCENEDWKHIIKCIKYRTICDISVQSLKSN